MNYSGRGDTEVLCQVWKTESGNMPIKLKKEDSGYSLKNIYFPSKMHLFLIFDDDDDDEYRFRL